MERWAQRTARAARIDHPEQVTPHVLRRSVAMFWLEQFNGNIWTVSQMLGHKDIRTTAAYLKAKFEADDPSPDQADSALDMLEDAAFEAATATQVASELWSDLPIPLLKPLPEAG